MQNAQHQELSRDLLNSFAHEELINLVLQLLAKNQQLADYARNNVSEKYGLKTERFVSPGQLLLFPGQATQEPEGAAEKGDTAAAKNESKTEDSKPKKPGHSRNQRPDLPHVDIDVPPPDSAQLPCMCCGTIRIPARRVLQSSRYQCIPARFYFEDLYSLVYECPNCPSKNDLVVKTPEVVPNGLAAPGFIAQILVARDNDHIPFNRQCNIYERSGVSFSRSTLSDFSAQGATILEPLYDYMHDLLLDSDIISTDDTPVKVLDRKKSKNIKLARAWGYVAGEKHPVTLLDFTQGRGRDGPLTFLDGFKGRLQGDCFSGNLAICAAIGTILVACIAHARRYFVKAMRNDKQGCSEALLMFQSLYEIEKTAKELELSPEDTRLMREQEAVPILNKLHKWLQQQKLVAQPKSSFGKAISYCLNNWIELTEYVKEGRLQIDNNHTEREMKYIAMGRKAWLFFGSDEGGKNHAIIISILATCRRHGIEPWSYLTDVIQRLTENPNENLEDLLPYKWKLKYPQRVSAEIKVLQGTPKAA
jgi:transposase